MFKLIAFVLALSGAFSYMSAQPTLRSSLADAATHNPESTLCSEEQLSSMATHLYQVHAVMRWLYHHARLLGTRLQSSYLHIINSIKSKLIYYRLCGNAHIDCDSLRIYDSTCTDPPDTISDSLSASESVCYNAHALAAIRPIDAYGLRAYQIYVARSNADGNAVKLYRDHEITAQNIRQLQAHCSHTRTDYTAPIDARRAFMISMLNYFDDDGGLARPAVEGDKHDD